MADHDRDAGSRGEEEAPRDPSSAQPTQNLNEPGGDRDRLRYGEQADQAYTHIPPMQPGPASWERETPRADGFFRRRRTQVVGAGLVGLVAGVLLGGVTVAAFSDAAEDHGRFGHVQPGWAPRAPEFGGPGNMAPYCEWVDGGVRCAAPPPGMPDAPNPDAPNPMEPAPGPTSYG
ncbi:hypothetical protein GCM10022224_059430 [Nonomuraea antimicrobica]|uniref:Uncharacterized protein n=1 Tax=Nonomuraea antimicrobica TaxID=561173 RepID=A0ABP7CC46_9ACTN